MLPAFGKRQVCWYDCIRSQRSDRAPGTTSQGDRLPLGRMGNFRAMRVDAERDAAYWRRLEADARTIATTMTDAEPRRIMFFIADGYKLLADRAELRKTQKD